MNSKERMQRALLGQPTDVTAVAPMYLHLYLSAEVRRQALLLYEQRLGSQSEIHLSPQEEVELQTLAYCRAWESVGETPDWIWTRWLRPSEWLAECVIRREAGKVWRVQLASGQREELSDLTPETGGSTTDRWEQDPPRSDSEVDALVPVRPAAELIRGGEAAMIRSLVEAVGDRVFVCGGAGSPFWKLYGVLGFQNQMIMPLEAPGLLHRLLRRQTDALIETVRTYAALGVHGVFVEECLVSADMISARVYREFVVPYT